MPFSHSYETVINDLNLIPEFYKWSNRLFDDKWLYACKTMYTGKAGKREGSSTDHDFHDGAKRAGIDAWEHDLGDVGERSHFHWAALDHFILIVDRQLERKKISSRQDCSSDRYCKSHSFTHLNWYAGIFSLNKWFSQRHYMNKLNFNLYTNIVSLQACQQVDNYSMAYFVDAHFVGHENSLASSRAEVEVDSDRSGRSLHLNLNLAQNHFFCQEIDFERHLKKKL